LFQDERGAFLSAILHGQLESNVRTRLRWDKLMPFSQRSSAVSEVSEKVK
jgi:hypothetical protein